MIPGLGGWTLRRSPLAPSVPLEGSETVQGLRTLERLRSASLLERERANSSRGAAAVEASQNRRRRYQRFKGPFLEQMTTDDFKKAPHPWKQFVGLGDEGLMLKGYNVPASVDILCERIEVRLIRTALRRSLPMPAPLHFFTHLRRYPSSAHRRT